MGFLQKLKANNAKTPENNNARVINTIKRSLSANGKKPEIKISKNISLPLDSFTTRHDMNVLLLKGKDEDKRTLHIEPNISAANRNYVIVDTDKSLYEQYGSRLEGMGYSVSLVNLNEPKESGYNPMGYVSDEKSAYYLAQGIMDNIGRSEISNDSKGMWETAELNILFAVIWALSETQEAPTMDDVIGTLEKGLPALDELFKTTSEKVTNEYAKFQESISPETQKGVVLSLISKLNPFKGWEKGMTPEEYISDSKEFVFSKKALFIIIPKDEEENLIAGIFIRQIVSAITKEMGKKGIFRPQYPLHFILNSVDKVGKICGFDEILASSKTQVFAFSIFSPSIKTLSDIYGDKGESIALNCDAVVCLDKADADTAEWISVDHEKKDEQQDQDTGEDEEAKKAAETAVNLEEGKIFVKVRGFSPVTDEVQR